MTPSRGLGCAVALLLAAAIAGGALVPRSARSDGDPASDVLVGASVFYPYSSTVSASLQRTLNGEAAAASRARYPVKVALIGAAFDLGAVPSLFGKPQAYASFLDQEIGFLNPRTRLLVVMPNGYGVRNLGAAAPRIVASLEKPAGAQGDDLARAAILALPKLAAAAGHPIAPAAGAPSSSGSSAGLKVAVLAISAIVIAGALFALRRGRARTG
jgi:hypothetical protein